jgi:predicted signal transduction protein with EAL and GGDEF domain
MRGNRGFRAVVVGVETAAAFQATIDGGGAAVHGGVGYGQPWDERMHALEIGGKGASREDGGGRDRDLLSGVRQ